MIGSAPVPPPNRFSKTQAPTNHNVSRTDCNRGKSPTLEIKIWRLRRECGEKWENICNQIRYAEGYDSAHKEMGWKLNGPTTRMTRRTMRISYTWQQDVKEINFLSGRMIAGSLPTEALCGTHPGNPAISSSRVGANAYKIAQGQSVARQNKSSGPVQPLDAARASRPLDRDVRSTRELKIGVLKYLQSQSNSGLVRLKDVSSALDDLLKDK